MGQVARPKIMQTPAIRFWTPNQNAKYDPEGEKLAYFCYCFVFVAVLFNKDQIISHLSEVFETQCSTDLKERRPAVLDNFLFSL